MPPRIRISATRTLIDSDAEEDAAAAAQFENHHGIVLDDLIEPDVLETLANIWTKARFVENDVGEVGSRTLEEPPLAGRLLRFVLQRPEFLGWLARVTGSPPLGSTLGSIAQIHAGRDHRLDWHNDAVGKRLLGVTVNLGALPYEGGRFEMKRRGSEDIVLRHDHKRPGSALVFSIDRDLLHRVTPVTAGGPRTVYSGWFLSTPPKPG